MKKLKLVFYISIFHAICFGQSVNSIGDEGSLSGFLKSNELYKDSISSNGKRFSGSFSTSRYLFDQPLKGKLFGVNKKTIDDSSYLFNYDKSDKKVLVYANNTIAAKVDVNDISSIEFISGDAEYWYEPNSLLAKQELFQVLVKRADKYILYKTIQGDDKNKTYYLTAPGNEVHSFTLNKRSINNLLSKDPKAEYYIKNHKKDEGDETYLKDFITYLNYF